MWHSLQQHLSIERLIWLFPVAFILHDLEEVFTMVSWMEQHQELMAHLPISPLVTTTAQVAGAVAFEWLLTIVAAYSGVKAMRRGRTHWFFMGLTAALFLNVFTHLGQVILAGGYIPGIWTAVIVILPYMLYLHRRLHTAGLLDRTGMVRALASGVPIGIATVLMAHQAGRLLF